MSTEESLYRTAVEEMRTFEAPQEKNDPVNHPSHYTSYKGLEIIDLTEQMNFNRGNAVKYIARAGLKNQNTEIEDLKKAVWYINREIDRIKAVKKLEDLPTEKVKAEGHWMDRMVAPNIRDGAAPPIRLVTVGSNQDGSTYHFCDTRTCPGEDCTMMHRPNNAG